MNDIPDTSHDWIHLIVARHSNLTNNHQLQIASSFTDNDRLFFRKIARQSLEPQDVAWHALAVLDQVVNKAGYTMTGALRVQKDLTVGAGANGALKVRHVNGKHYQNDTDDTLHLNWSTGRPVRVGGTSGDGKPSSLLVEGLVGIGTISPQYTLEVNGTAGKPGGGMWAEASDIRLKRNVQTLHDALTKLLQLRGVSYEWQEPDKHGNLTGEQMGLVAQEVEEVFPGWVSTNASGLKDVTIRGLEALVVEALRKINERITALELQQQQAT